MTNTKIEKAVEETEKVLKEFHEEVLIDMSLNNIISDTKEKWITNFFRKALLTAHQQGKKDRDEEVMEWAEGHILEISHAKSITWNDTNYETETILYGRNELLENLQIFINKNKTKTFYKVKTAEFPNGMFFSSEVDAREMSEMERENGGVAYFRTIKMTQKEFDNLDEEYE